MKKLAFIFRSLDPSPHSATRSAQDVLLQSIDRPLPPKNWVPTVPISAYTTLPAS